MTNDDLDLTSPDRLAELLEFYEDDERGNDATAAALVREVMRLREPSCWVGFEMYEAMQAKRDAALAEVARVREADAWSSPGGVLLLKAERDAALAANAELRGLLRECEPHVKEAIDRMPNVYPAGVALLARIAAALRDAAAKAAPQWQPIETAPKDGRSILLYSPSGAMVKASWEDVDFDEFRGVSLYDWVASGCVFAEWEMRSQPTHWMPLPPAPA